MYVYIYIYVTQSEKMSLLAIFTHFAFYHDYISMMSSEQNTAGMSEIRCTVNEIQLFKVNKRN